MVHTTTHFTDGEARGSRRLSCFSSGDGAETGSHICHQSPDSLQVPPSGSRGPAPIRPNGPPGVPPTFLLISQNVPAPPSLFHIYQLRPSLLSRPPGSLLGITSFRPLSPPPSVHVYSTLPTQQDGISWSDPGPVLTLEGNHFHHKCRSWLVGNNYPQLVMVREGQPAGATEDTSEPH